jgi:hypothetical protein
MKTKLFAVLVITIAFTTIVFRLMKQDTPKDRTAYVLRESIELSVEKYRDAHKMIDNGETKNHVTFTPSMEAKVVVVEAQRLCNGKRGSLLESADNVGGNINIFSGNDTEIEKRLIDKILDQYKNDCPD